MRVPRLQFTVRQLMVAVAIVAVLLIPVVWLIRVGQALEDFYGPGGRLEAMRQGKPDPGPRR
jgi:hypothetical protein